MTLSVLRRTLKEAGVPDPDTDARLLLSHLFGVSPATLLAEPSCEYDSPALRDAVRRRCLREPLQHILGEVFFYGERYAIGPECLIPRADTEILVDTAIDLLPKGALFADFCTGSGCIALSVLAHREDLSAIAVDLSPHALRVAQKNAESLGLSSRITFFAADLLSDELPFSVPDYILSNPPYIRKAVLPTLAPELAYEPSMALDGGEDGLLFYRTFLDRFSPKCFLFEIGFDQAAAVCATGDAHGYSAQVLADAGGNDRLVILKSDRFLSF